MEDEERQKKQEKSKSDQFPSLEGPGVGCKTARQNDIADKLD
jgi:hypothetical protein